MLVNDHEERAALSQACLLEQDREAVAFVSAPEQHGETLRGAAGPCPRVWPDAQ